MQTPTRPALMGKSKPDLVHMLRLMGADSRAGESKESIINRILLFQKQEFKPDVKIERKPLKAMSEAELHKLLHPYILRGLKVEVRDLCWHVSIDNRQDSGSLSMPPATIERTVKYLMPKDK